jgi:hypothetical protein
LAWTGVATLAGTAAHLTLLRAAEHSAAIMLAAVAAACVQRYDQRDDAENQRETGAYREQYLLNLI